MKVVIPTEQMNFVGMHFYSFVALNCDISRRLNIFSVFSSSCSDEDSPHSVVCVSEEEFPPSS